MNLHLPARHVGESEATLPVITLGTMRLAEHGGTIDEAAALFENAIALGVDMLHSSREYESFPFTVEALRRVHGRSMRHIVKLADPHFDEPCFEARRFRQRFDDYLTLLGTDRIDVVQWMCRAHIDNPVLRCRAMRSVYETMPEVVADLREAGKLGSLIAFPYRAEDIDALLPHSWCEGFSLYLNAAELSYVRQLDTIEASGRGVVALRPFYGGQLFGDDPSIDSDTRLDRHLRLALTHPCVATTVVSTSSKAHLMQLVRIATDVSIDRSEFARAVADCEPAQ